MRIVLRPGKDKKIRKGYPWVFANQLLRIEGEPDTGDVVRVVSSDGEAFGQALYHDRSQIVGRFLTRDAERTIDADFFRERLDDALALRRLAFPDATHARLIFGESDGIPGTIVDRYGPPGYTGGVLTFSTLSFGIEQRRELLLDLLEERLRPDAIVERNDAPLRGKDDLEERTGVLRGSYEAPIEIEEGGVRFAVDPLTGPKTGFFIDQRLNRDLVTRFAHGRRVLDVFSSDGAFGLRAAAAGAVSVHCLDVSEPALGRVRANAERNGFADRVTTEAADALDRLGQMADGMAAAGTSDFDTIILDPPGFAKSRTQLDGATKAYQRINISALKMLPPGGILATASCSQALSEEGFLDIIRYSARKVGAPLRLLARGTQPPDHPVLDAMEETAYLKFFVFQKGR